MSIDNSRRKFLQTSGLGIGWLAALDLFQSSRRWQATPGPLSPKTPPLPATAKSVIHLFMQGGPSQVDTFDPKPLLTKLHGQHPPASFGDEDFQNGQFREPGDPRLQTDVQEVRPVRPRGVGSVSSHCAASRRPRRDPLLLSRRLHALAGAVPDQQRLGRASAGRASARGFCMAWAPRTRTCRVSWCCSRAASGPVRRFTGRGFCRRHIRGRRSGRAGIRFSI